MGKIPFSDNEALGQLKVFFEYLHFKGRASILISTMEADYEKLLVCADRKRLRQLYKEMGELLRETFSLQQLDEFKANFLERSAYDGIAIDSDIEKILTKDNICSDREFSLLKNYIESELGRNESAELKERINKLLHRYEFASGEG